MQVWEGKRQIGTVKARLDWDRRGEDGVWYSLCLDGFEMLLVGCRESSATFWQLEPCNSANCRLFWVVIWVLGVAFYFLSSVRLA